MTDYSILKLKIDSFKALVEQDSITPVTLGTLLEEIVELLASVEADNPALPIANEAQRIAVSASESSTLAISKSESALKASNDNKSKIQTINESRGAPGGIATLDDGGAVPLSQLPVGQLKDVVEFGGMAPPLVTEIKQSSMIGEGDVVFMASTGTFVFRSEAMPPEYYANWGGADAYGEPSAQGRVPSAAKLYLDVSANRQYRYDGSALILMGSDLVLGEAAGTAFAGDKGKQLHTDVEALKTRMPVIVFDGLISTEQDLDQLPAGFYFHTGQNRFGYSDGAAQSWDPDDGHTGNSAEDRASYLFRCGVRLFHFVDDSMYEFVDAERFDELRAEIIDEVMTRLQGLGL